jgi:geranylgeranyl diphosphate synthase, type II
MDLLTYLSTHITSVDAALTGFLPAATEEPESLHKAMRYCVFSGGKRLRPVLCLAAAEACGGDISAALIPACAVELMHTYSLVHDDLPAMDDDELRRGRPTCHIAFGEGVAILCGDALLTESFLLLNTVAPTPHHRVQDFVAELARAGSSRCLIGGQVMDLEGEGSRLTSPVLVRMHEAKTAALIIAAVRLGAMTANATPDRLVALTKFGRSLGLAFQLLDDILDVTKTTEELGKTAGKDMHAAKSTLPSICGLADSRKEAERLTTEALEALEPLGKDAERLREIATHLLKRER